MVTCRHIIEGVGKRIVGIHVSYEYTIQINVIGFRLHRNHARNSDLVSNVIDVQNELIGYVVVNDSDVT